MDNNDETDSNKKKDTEERISNPESVTNDAAPEEASIEMDAAESKELASAPAAEAKAQDEAETTAGDTNELKTQQQQQQQQEEEDEEEKQPQEMRGKRKQEEGESENDAKHENIVTSTAETDSGTAIEPSAKKEEETKKEDAPEKSSDDGTDTKGDKDGKNDASAILEKENLLARPLKKARTAYFIFQDEKRPQVQAQHPGESVGTIARAMGQLWSALTPAEKEPYQLRAASERELVSRQLQELKKAGLLPTAGVNPNSMDSSKDENASSTSMLLPLARIRKICKLDPEVRGISKEAVMLVTIAAEQFTVRLGREVTKVAQMQNRRKLLPEDVAEVCELRDEMMFLKDDVKDLVREIRLDKKGSAPGGSANEKVIKAVTGVKPLTSYFGATSS